MKSFFKFFVDRPLLANIITIMVLLLGLLSLPGAKREIFPDVDLGEVYISTRFIGASPEDVELQVTNKIEKELKGIDGIDYFTSTSFENISTIMVRISPDAKNLADIKRKIREGVDKVTDLPAEVDERPTILEIDSEAFPVLEIGIVGDINYDDLRQYAKSFEKKLENVKGVSNVTTFGLRAREVQVEGNPQKLSSYQVSLLDLVQAIGQRNLRASMGAFKKNGIKSVVMTNSQFEQPEDVGDVIVRSNFEGQTVRIKDVAIIKDGYVDETTRNHFNGIQAISFQVSKTAGADIVKTVEKLQALIEQEKAYLPEGTSFMILNDMSKYLKNRLSVMMSNGLLGLIGVSIVLTLFLRINTAFWVALGIPISLMGTLFLMPVFGASINIVSLMAMIIIVGIIVDDAIIVAENIIQKREAGLSPKDAAVEGVYEVFKPVITTILTTFMAFAPMLFMKGIMGKFVYVIPLVISLALFISMIESLLALPSHLVHGLEKIKKGDTENSMTLRFFRKMKLKYKRILFRLIKFRYWVLLGFVALFVFSLIYAALFIKFDLFPEAAADQFYINIEAERGLELEETAKRIKRVEDLVSETVGDAMLGFTTRLGVKGDNYQYGEKENHGLLIVDLVPFGGRTKTARYYVEELRRLSAEMPNKDFEVKFTVDSGGPPVGAAVTFRIVGDNDPVREKLANDIIKYLNSFEGTKDIERDDESEPGQLILKLDYEKISRLGIPISNVIQTIRSTYSGVIASTVRYEDEDVDFRVFLDKEKRYDFSVLKGLMIPNQTGRLVPLNRISRFEKSDEMKNFYHYNNQRSIKISGGIDEKKTNSLDIAKQIKDKFDLKNYPDTTIVYGGEAEELQETMMGLFISFIAAAIGIYFILMLLLNSPLQPFIVLLAIPFGIMGVIAAFGAHNTDLGFLAMVGTVGLAGVVVNDSLVLVNTLNVMRRNKPERNVYAIIVWGSARRFRPIILTTITTVSGLIPLAYGWGGSDPFIEPMGLALGYGLFFSTPLTLLVLPCIYMIFYDFRLLLERNKFIKKLLPKV